jgi:rhodanese-related sulfurtransferase
MGKWVSESNTEETTMMKRLFCMLLLTTAFSFNGLTQPVSSNEKQELPAVGLITVEELQAKLSTNTPVTIIDVRSSDGYANSTERIKGAIHIKLRRLRSRLSFPPLKDVPRGQEIVTYCACPSEESSIAAAKILLENGFKRVRALKGGWQEWRKAGGNIESKPKGI